MGLHHPRAGLVEQVAVLDRAHARLHRAGDRARRIGMGHRVQVGGLGLLAGGAQLVDRELRAFERIGRAGDAAAGHDLDLVGAVAHLLAHRAPHLADAVGDRADQAQPGAGAEHLARAHALGPHVGMAAGLADREAGDEQPRALEQPARHRLLQPEIGARRIAHRREAAVQHALHDRAGAAR